MSTNYISNDYIKFIKTFIVNKCVSKYCKKILNTSKDEHLHEDFQTTYMQNIKKYIYDLDTWSKIMAELYTPIQYLTYLYKTTDSDYLIHTETENVFLMKTFQEYIDSAVTLQKVGAYDYQLFIASMKKPEFKPTNNSYSSWSMTDKEINPSPEGADLNLHRFKPTKNSIRTADSHSLWSMTDKEINTSPEGADLNLHRFKNNLVTKYDEYIFENKIKNYLVYVTNLYLSIKFNEANVTNFTDREKLEIENCINVIPFLEFLCKREQMGNSGADGVYENEDGGGLVLHKKDMVVDEQIQWIENETIHYINDNMFM